MFDIGGYELIVIAAVAILVVGPRELPGMLRSVGRFVKQARQMMTGVQRQFNDALKEAELDDVKKTIDDVRSLNPANKLRKTIAKEFKPFADAGDSVKKSVGQVSAKGPAPAAATAAAATDVAATTEAAADATAVEAPVKATPAKAAPAKTTSAKTTTAKTTTAAKKTATKKPAAKTASKPSVGKTSAGKPSAAASTSSTLTQSKPRKSGASAKPAGETPASNTSASDGG